MALNDWFGIALLVLLSLLTIGVFVSVFISIVGLRHSRKHPPAPPPMLTVTPGVLPPRAVHAPLAAVEMDADVRRYWSALTKREKQVASLAVQWTDAEIANHLHITDKTVGNHMTNIFSKLGIHSRHELKYVVGQLGDLESND